MILIYSPSLSNRFRYIIQFIFEDVAPQDYDFCSDIQDFTNYIGPKINYSNARITSEELFINSSELLKSEGVSEIEVPVLKVGNEIRLFPMEESDLKFDIFAAIFYLISRYEEYLPFEKDKHRRFEANQSFAYRNFFLERPVVDEWIILLKAELSSKFPELKWDLQKFRFTPTLDIDQAFKIKGKSIFRIGKQLLVSLIKFKLFKVITILKVYLGIEKDPFDQFDNIEALHRKYNFTAIYFFLFSNKFNRFDINISTKNKEFRKRIKQVSKTAFVGIHPSYHSRYDYRIIDEEINTLTNVLNIPINSSRQHYLKLRFPSTYKSLISLGIANEYTMGYASMPGFRASTTHSFRFYDIKHEQVSFLRIHPFCVMDATFITYLKYTEEQAFDSIKVLMYNVKKVDGHFISLWHNESFSEQTPWVGWSGLYEKMLKLASKED